MGNEFLSENAMGRGFWDEAIAFAQRNKAAGRTIGSIARVAWSGFGLTSALYGKGRLAEARAEALTTLQLAEQIGENRLATWVDPALAMISADLGDDDAAGMHGERGWERARALDQAALTGWALMALWHTALQRAIPGQRSNGRRSTSRWSRAPRTVSSSSWHSRAPPKSRSWRGGSTRASASPPRRSPWRNWAGRRTTGALARSVQGRIALARGDVDAAARLQDEAHRHTRGEWKRARPRPGPPASCRRARRADERDAARAELARARDAFAELGAAREAARAEALLAKLG